MTSSDPRPLPDTHHTFTLVHNIQFKQNMISVLTKTSITGTITIKTSKQAYNKLVLPKSRFLQHVAPEQSTNPSKTLGSIVPMFARI